MGTAISLQISDPLPAELLGELAEQTFDWLREVDRRFSTYREDSEVNRFHRGELTIEECSPELRHVIETCADLWIATDGYFDTYATGRFDPSGYVKGWSVQVASDRLLAAGSYAHWINAGGDIRARGGPRPGEPWRIGIRHPVEADKVVWVLAVSDLAVATSGTYERGRHVVDPRRGVPATGLSSVTVTGPDLGTADAYATAGLAMGEAGLRWLAELPAGYEVGAITDELTGFHSAGLPVAPDEDWTAPDGNGLAPDGDGLAPDRD
ncbi:FAD:protein FMN transferase [Plantactinospora siamensis]|uniref:FAD:protein FMN transferase n=1 Tax=Plantactinospora siamensis TaxID=555372 RepID=A0ABV6NTE3_9ACTN